MLPLAENIIDFIITSPPYINVFNYHQNYRYSVEALGWDLLKIAKSEIGSNRANRRNRFLTVTQYCLDMAMVLKEIQRVCKQNSRMIFVVFIDASKYYPDVFQRMIDKMQILLDDTSPRVDKVLEKGHF